VGISVPIWLFIEPLIFAGFLILLRISAMLISLPGLSGGAFPAPTKMMIVTFLTVFCYSAMGMPIVPAPSEPSTAILMLARELILGAGMGLVLRMLFAIADVAGSIAGMVMALSMAGMVDPATGEQTTAVSSLLSISAMLLFVGMGGHHEAVRGLLYNLELYPIGGTALIAFDVEALSKMGHGLFIAALQIAAPIIMVTTLINVGLGLMARAAPQLNIFAVGFSVLLCVGILLLDTTLFAVREAFEARVPTLAEDMNVFLGAVE